MSSSAAPASYGSQLVTTLRAHGLEAVAASSESGVNTLTGEGLAEVLEGATVVVDVADSPSLEDRTVMQFFTTSTRNLLGREVAAGVRHHVALLPPGTERLLESGYFRARYAQAQLIKESPMPYSFVRATPFFESLGTIADARARYFGAHLSERSLMAGDEAELGEIRFDDWLRHAVLHLADASAAAPIERASLKANEFRISDVPPGSVLLLGNVAVFSVAGGFCATQSTCTHRAGPLSEGTVDDTTVTCPLHGSRFNIWTGAVLHGPAKEPINTYRVTVDGEVGRVDVPPAHAVRSGRRCD